MRPLTRRYAAHEFPLPASRGEGGRRPGEGRHTAILALALLVVSTIHAGDVFVPPKLQGVKGDGTGRHSDKPIPFPAANEQWILARSKHFVLISSAGERQTRDIAAGLETLAAALTQMSPRFSATASPTRVFLFGRHREAQPYFDMLINRREANVTGVFVSQKQGGSMLMRSGYGLRSERTPYHELVHYLITNTGKRPPLWIEEGLAEYFSSAELRKGTIYAGLPLREHLEALQRRSLIPLRQLFAIVRESDAYNLPAGQHAFYAESWAVVDSLMRSGRDAFYDFLRDLENGVAVEAALREHYAKSVDDLERAISFSAARPQFGISLTVPDADTSVTVTPLDRAELLYQLGRFLAGVEDGSANAERHFREALAVNPAHARAMAALGRFDNALAADPNDPDIHLDYAESLLKNAIGPLAEAEETSADDIPSFRQARALAEKALALGGDAGRAKGDIGTSYIVERDLTNGIAALEKSRALLPGRMDYALHLFSMYRRVGDRARADALFAVLDKARDAQVAYAARAIVLRVELARANALVQQQKLDEAAAVIRDLASNTPDADAKRDLVHQADEIAHAAETNRQIDIYNKAVGEVNRGDYAAAMKTLRQLLSSATDATVIRDAKKLQKQLASRSKS
jgi:tetratricopeptide (TPR) repeat protein